MGSYMKKMLLEYSLVIGYTVVGLVFGLSFFLLFLNFYHYDEVNYYYQKNSDDLKLSSEFKEQLVEIRENVNSFDINLYSGREDIYSLASVGNKLDLCIKNINDSEFFKILDKKKISISDVYKLQQFYENDVVNECLIKQLYDLTISNESSNIKISSLGVISPFLNTSIVQLKDDNNYVKSNIRNNSSYYFSSNSSKLSVFNMTRDSYYEVISSYRSAINFVEQVSIWYRNVVIGG